MIKGSSKAGVLAAAVAAFGLVTAASAPASAAFISSFSRTTNDGVFTLSAAQASYLGVPTADRLGFVRIRSGGTPSVSWSAGDTFDATSIMAFVTSNAANILGLFNGVGDPALIAYTGSAFDPLGTTTLLTSGDVSRGVAFAFSSTGGNVVFKGTTTFSGAQTQGPSMSPVPLPGTVWLFGTAIAGLGVFGWRRRAA